MTTRELESTKRNFWFAVDAFSLIPEWIQIQILHFCKVEAALVAAESARPAAEPNFPSLKASESVFRGEVCQRVPRVKQLGFEAARMHQDCSCKMEDVLFDRDGLQMRLDSTTSQLLGSI